MVTASGGVAHVRFGAMCCGQTHTRTIARRHADSDVPFMISAAYSLPSRIALFTSERLHRGLLEGQAMSQLLCKGIGGRPRKKWRKCISSRRTSDSVSHAHSAAVASGSMGGGGDGGGDGGGMGGEYSRVTWMLGVHVGRLLAFTPVVLVEFAKVALVAFPPSAPAGPPKTR